MRKAKQIFWIGNVILSIGVSLVYNEIGVGLITFGILAIIFSTFKAANDL